MTYALLDMTIIIYYGRHMSQIKQEPPIKLAAPGDGISFPQRLLMTFYVRPFVAEKAKIEDSKKRFIKISEKILKEIEGLSETQMTQQVLVPPQKGLEDSSRFWSIAMTLEHLGIVGRKMILGIEMISAGHKPPQKVEIAKYKPINEMSAQESIQDFQKFITTDFSNMKISNPDSPITLRHPWFGEMKTKGFVWLLGVHQGLHLQQIREIKKGLKK